MPGVPGAASTRRRLRAATFCGHDDCPSSDQFQYGNVKDKVLAEEEDRFIVCMTHQLGYGLWKELPCLVRQHWTFRVAWFIKSCTPKEPESRFKEWVCLVSKELQAEGAANTNDRADQGHRGCDWGRWSMI